MTLNITATFGNVVTQVSDRRMINPATGGLVDDEANKAVVVACQDALLAITFTGIGKVRDTRVDTWLVESLADAGMAELDAAHLVAHIAEAATDWFKTFPSSWSTAHIFTVAGWQWADGQPVPRLWYVGNTGQRDLSGAPQIRHWFAVTPLRTRNKLTATGCFPALTRGIRRRMIARLRKATGVDAIEDGLVQGIRDAAGSGKWSSSIGKSCMAISLSPYREARATYHPERARAQTCGPHLLWYAGGRSVLLEDIEVVPGAAYSVRIGGGPEVILQLADSRGCPWPDPPPRREPTGWPPRVIQALSKAADRPAPLGPGLFGFKAKIGLRDAKYRTSDPLEEIPLVSEIRPRQIR